jgi:secreted PhoX family phosphatase
MESLSTHVFGEQNRREFLSFLGKGVLAASATGPLLSACAPVSAPSDFRLRSISPSTADRIRLAEGLRFDILLRTEDPIGESGLAFGSNADFTQPVLLPELPADELILWVNHEYPETLTLLGHKDHQRKVWSEVEKEMKTVGGSFVHLKRTGNHFTVLPRSNFHRRLDAQTEIDLVADRPIAGSRTAVGTLANCSGGITPWNTILTCEENFDSFYDEPGEETRHLWERFVDRPTEHYGWVVEIDPKTGASKKLTSLGRFSHECAHVVTSPSGKPVIYSGDDKIGEHLYKLIPSSNDSLERGTLYVASLERGEWIPLTRDAHPVLAREFEDDVEILTHCRRAAKLVGATPLDRPEDIERNPNDGSILVALTNNKREGNYHGSILRIREDDADPESLRFTSDTFISGGVETGFSSPDNLAFDPAGNLWFTTDISGRSIGRGEYASLGNNGLFVVPVSGPSAGQAIRIATAPVAAEFTGPSFTADGKTLFLSVQHPGETSPSLDQLTSRWPDGSDRPRSAVITLSGPTLESITRPTASRP